MSASVIVINITTVTAKPAACGFPAPSSFETLVLLQKQHLLDKFRSNYMHINQRQVKVSMNIYIFLRMCIGANLAAAPSPSGIM